MSKTVLFKRIRNVLLECDEFKANESLRTFVANNELLEPWKDVLPQTNNVSERVDTFIESFHNRSRNDNSENLLVLALAAALSGNKPKESQRHDKLKKLATELRRCLKANKTDETNEHIEPAKKSISINTSPTSNRSNRQKASASINVFEDWRLRLAFIMVCAIFSCIAGVLIWFNTNIPFPPTAHPPATPLPISTPPVSVVPPTEVPIEPMSTLLPTHTATSVVPPTSTLPNAPLCDSITQLPKTECEVLLDIYNNNSEIPVYAGWFQSNQPCEWEGVVCTSDQQHVQELNLHNTNTTYLPPSLNDLPRLYRLKLGKNALNLPLPSVGQLANLVELDVGASNMTGSISSEICNLTNLRRLHLDNNNFTGQLPECIANLDSLVNVAVDNAGFCVPDQLKSWLAELETDIHDNGVFSEDEWAKLRCN